MLLLPEPDPIDIVKLSETAGVSTRTVRYYIQQGLLPAPETRGPGAHYGPEHVDRLRLIRKLQQEHLPLSEIRKRLENLRPEEIKRLVEMPLEVKRSSASDYVRRVLSEGAASYASPAAAMSVASARLSREHVPPNKIRRSHWERFTLSPDIELHIRRPGSKEQNRQLERILEAAREILKEDVL